MSSYLARCYHIFTCHLAAALKSFSKVSLVSGRPYSKTELITILLSGNWALYQDLQAEIDLFFGLGPVSCWFPWSVFSSSAGCHSQYSGKNGTFKFCNSLWNKSYEYKVKGNRFLMEDHGWNEWNSFQEFTLKAGREY